MHVDHERCVLVGSVGRADYQDSEKIKSILPCAGKDTYTSVQLVSTVKQSP